MKISPARKKGIITGFLKNQNPGAPLKNKANQLKKKRTARTSRPMTRTSTEPSTTPTSITPVTITTTTNYSTTVTITTTTDVDSSATASGTAVAATSKSHISQKHYTDASKVTLPTTSTRSKYKNWTVEPYKIHQRKLEGA